MYPEGKLLFFKQKQLKKVISFISNHHRYYYYIYIFDDEAAKLLSRDWGGGGLQSPWWGHCSWLLGNTSGLMDLIYPVYLYFSYQDKLQN